LSRIDRLVAEHCPDGVPHLPFSSVGSFLRGGGPQKKDFQSSGVGCIHYGQIYTYYGTATKVANAFVSEEVAARSRKAKPGDVIIAVTGENDVDLARGVAWLGSDPVAVSNHTLIFTSDLDPKYVSYFLRSSQFDKEKRRYITGTKVRSISSGAFDKIRLPVPPIEVQRAIVEILDMFTELEAELEAELAAELKARQEQFAYYRRVILTSVDAANVSLASLGKWQGGITPSTSDSRYWSGGDIPWLASMDISNESTNEIRGRVTVTALQETGLKIVPAPSVAVVMRSNILRRRLPIGLVEVDTTLNQDMRLLSPREDVDAEYVYQVLRSESEEIRSQCVRLDGSMAAVNSQAFFAWEIPLPSIVEQRRIADQVRSLEVLVNDLSIGLPAELNSRRKQYEYYRDKLLSFQGLNKDATEHG
jgi:type I restriction enzyme S subunit